ncbi:Uncharacterised protein [Salmonella enterica subsp. enterica serovar Typhi]|nr:Uncharacterised protein [Salmonella enterica subsp. enterica serovar Typhi]
MKKLKKLLLEILIAVMLSLSLPAMTMAADTGVPGAMCQSAGVWQGLIKNICWSCIFPMRIMGIGAAPPPHALVAIARIKMGYQKSDGS